MTLTNFFPQYTKIISAIITVEASVSRPPNQQNTYVTKL